MTAAHISFAETAKAMREDLRLEVREKMPFATVVALTRTAVKASALMQDHIRHKFDRPTQYAIGAPRAVPAKKTTLSSAVLLRDFGGTPAGNYLGPEIIGGPRGQKRFEKALTYIGALPSGGFATPGAGAAMDQFGNQRSGEIVKILSTLKAFGETGYHANRSKGWAKKTRVGQIFVVRAGSNQPGLKPGIYKRGADCQVVPLMIFPTRTPHYTIRLPFEELVMADADKLFVPELEAALKQFG